MLTQENVKKWLVVSFFHGLIISGMISAAYLASLAHQ